MKKLRLPGYMFLFILIAGLLVLDGSPVFSGQNEKLKTDDSPKFRAYYFYTSKRCGPCRRIEQWSQEAIETAFKNEIQSGVLQWQAINVDKSENRHFIQEFKLYTKSVVIVELNNDRPLRWNTLEDVWQLYGDREKFFNYVTETTREFMEKG